MSCQRNVCSMCGGSSNTQPNFQKLVDPPIRQYGTFMGDRPQSDYSRGPPRGGCMPPMQISIPQFAGSPPPPTGRHNPGQQPCIVKVPYDPIKPSPQIVCQPCAPVPPTKIWLIKSSPAPQKVGFGLNRLLMFLLSACLPMPGPSHEQCPAAKMVVCLPCPPPCYEEAPKKKAKKGPIGVITSCKEADLIGGKFINTCTCGKRNGLSPDECPRISCIDNPGCWAKPFPLCWPQYKEEKEPERPPPQELICIPIELHFQQPDVPFTDNRLQPR